MKTDHREGKKEERTGGHNFIQKQGRLIQWPHRVFIWNNKRRSLHTGLNISPGRPEPELCGRLFRVASLFEAGQWTKQTTLGEVHD